MLQLKDIRKKYVTAGLVQNALDGVTLNLRDREFVAILGPSGSGKTTLLNVIGGLDRYDSGDLIINGISTNSYHDRDWDTYRNHSIGFIFQSYNLIPHQTVLANVELALTISGVSMTERRARAVEALEKVGLGDQIRKKPSQLSGGQMQRVAIARALVNDPDILLADEPTGALDSETSVQVMDLLKEVAKDRLVVMVTHNPELADEYATRIVRIKDGKITDDTDPFFPEAETFSGMTAAANAAGMAAASAAEKEEREENRTQEPDDSSADAPKRGKNRKKKARMSFFTALLLSFNNLRTKKARTILVAIAGSIGIIGIALIQSLSNGVNDYIHKIEEDTVSLYPVSIDSTGINISAYISMFSSIGSKSAQENDRVEVDQVIHNYAAGLTNNDLKSLKSYLENRSNIYDYAKAVEYSYGIVPRIYRREGDGIRRVNPDEAINNMGMRYEQVAAIGLVAFSKLPADKDLYIDQYELKAGHWPENNDECIVVLGEDGSITDTVLYALGLRTNEELDEVVRKLIEGEDVFPEENIGSYTYEDLMNVKFKVINRYKYFVYDKENDFWTDKISNKTSYLDEIYEGGLDLKVCGVAIQKEDEEGMLGCSIYYPASLVTDLINEAAGSDIVKAQMANRSINVITGKKFSEATSADELDLQDFISVDEDALKEAFSFDTSKIEITDSMLEELDFSDMDFSGLDFSGMKGFAPELSVSWPDIRELAAGIKFTGTEESVRNLFTEITDAYLETESGQELVKAQDYVDALSEYLSSDAARSILSGFVIQIAVEALQNAEVDPETGTIMPEEVAAVLSGIEITDDQLAALTDQLSAGFAEYAANVPEPDVQKILEGLGEYLTSDEVGQKISDYTSENVDTSGAQQTLFGIIAGLASDLQSQLAPALTSVMDEVMTELSDQLQTKISDGFEGMMEELSSQFEEAFQVDEEAIADAFEFNMSEESIKDLITTMSSGISTTYETNLTDMGYADLNEPQSIEIYSKDFASKGMITGILSDYNTRMKEEDPSKVVTYSDLAGTMMASVSNIINVISTVLIALVAISLVVSSIMIGVITYISVLERRKEIGILRAMGASKGNVANVFNAETFITGLFAGLLGVIVSRLIIIPANWAIHEIANQPDISAYLDPRAAILLVALSIILNIISGFLPSRKAAKSNPVAALREE